MATFTPPIAYESSGDVLFGRYKVPVGVSVLLVDGHYVHRPYVWLGEIRPEGGAELIEGETWFQGGHTYTVSGAVGNQLLADGFDVNLSGYGDDGYGEGEYGE